MEPEAPEVSRARALGARTETRDEGQGDSGTHRARWRAGQGGQAAGWVGLRGGHHHLGGGTTVDSLRLSPTGHSALCLSLIQGSGGRSNGRVPSPASVGPSWAAGEGTPVLPDTSPHHTAGVQTRPPGNGGQPHTVRVLTRPVLWAARRAQNNESRETKADSELAASHLRHMRNLKVPYFC